MESTCSECQGRQRKREGVGLGRGGKTPQELAHLFPNYKAALELQRKAGSPQGNLCICLVCHPHHHLCDRLTCQVRVAQSEACEMPEFPKGKAEFPLGEAARERVNRPNSPLIPGLAHDGNEVQDIKAESPRRKRSIQQRSESGKSFQ